MIELGTMISVWFGRGGKEKEDVDTKRVGTSSLGRGFLDVR